MVLRFGQILRFIGLKRLIITLLLIMSLYGLSIAGLLGYPLTVLQLPSRWLSKIIPGSATIPTEFSNTYQLKLRETINSKLFQTNPIKEKQQTKAPHLLSKGLKFSRNLAKKRPGLFSLIATREQNFKRKQLLNGQCQRHGVRRPPLNYLMLVNHQHKMVFCYIPKVGCTFFKRLMLILNGKYQNVSSPYDIAPTKIHMLPIDLLSTRPRENAAVLRAYKKVVFVRDPYTRLFSGYLDKIFMPRQMFKTLCTYIIKTFRKSVVKNSSIICPLDVTFEEFLRYVIHSNLKNVKKNYHFGMMHDLCGTCNIKYDIIGKLDTFVPDLNLMFEEIGEGHRMSAKNMVTERVGDDLTVVVDHAFHNKNNTCVDFSQILRRTWRRAQIRGFVSMDLDFPFTNNQTLFVTKQEFLDTIKDASLVSKNDKSLKVIKNEAMSYAYSTVPMDVLDQLEVLLKDDCLQFGYDTRPKHVFEANQRTWNFNYFNV
ncbi:carbohydrate sulfotransferase 10-like isoform X4 [Octopus sinensis]|uniref:Carbohydrate sulfotransferase n=1 Tax=Octopus sinensis TaxID=2607531 RepID=A0A7E6FJ52_9MOLL|nr:carbohydrate sulfotransferase 10-like isoform X4 [Octopus sinensis]